MYKKIIKICILLLLNINALHCMESNKVVIKVGDEEYPMTIAQASKSQLIKNMLKNQDESQKMLDLSDYATSDLFVYVYRDLIGKNYNAYDLQSKVIFQLFNTARTLQIDELREKYGDLAVEHVQEITFLVEDQPFVMTVAQAKRSLTLKNLLESVEDYDDPIPLGGSLYAYVFNYVYKDLTAVQYDSMTLSDEMLVNLVNAANYLDIPFLLKKYQNLLLKRVMFIDTENKLQKFIDLIDVLPEEMKEPLSYKLCAKAKLFFKNLPQAEIKRMKNREYKGEIIISSNKKLIAIQNKSSFQLINLVTNQKLWEKQLGEKELVRGDLLFSSENDQVIVNSFSRGSRFVQIFDIQTGEELLNKQISYTFVLIGLFSGINRIVMRNFSDKKIILLDTANGDIVFETPMRTEGIRCYYNNDLHILGIYFEDFTDTNLSSLLIIDVLSNQIIKNKKDTALEHFKISPDGNKIIGLSKELIRIENTTDDSGTIAWAFPKPRPTMPRIGAFSEKNNLFTIIAKESNNETVWDSFVGVLDINSEQPIWAKVLPALLTFFSPHGNELLIRYKDDISFIDLDEKKERWFRNWQGLHDTYFIAKGILAGSLPYQQKYFNIEFVDTKNGKTFSSYVLPEKSKYHYPMFLTIMHNFLYLNFDKKKENKRLLYCLNILPVKIISFLNQSYIPLNQALLVRYIFTLISKNTEFISSAFLDKFGYDDLPQAIKDLVEMNNKPFIEKKVENVVKRLKDIDYAKKLKHKDQ